MAYDYDDEDEQRQAEREKTTVRQLLADNEDASNTRHGILTEDEAATLGMWLEDRT